MYNDSDRYHRQAVSLYIIKEYRYNVINSWLNQLSLNHDRYSLVSI